MTFLGAPGGRCPQTRQIYPGMCRHPGIPLGSVQPLKLICTLRVRAGQASAGLSRARLGRAASRDGLTWLARRSREFMEFREVGGRFSCEVWFRMH